MHTLTRFALSTFASLLLFCSASQLATAQTTVVVPSARDGSEGNDNSRFPFDLEVRIPSMRYQQVYAASEFTTGAVVITQIRLRPDGPFGSEFSTTLPDIQINFSTTTRNPDELSSTFADNVGADDTVVYARGPLTLLSGNIGPLGGPKEFDIIISLTTPFIYNPAQGNLLMDVRSYSRGPTTIFDAEFTTEDSVSYVYSPNVNSLTGTSDTIGLITAFVVAPAPSEPPAEERAWTVVGSTGAVDEADRSNYVTSNFTLGVLNTGTITARYTIDPVDGLAFANPATSSTIRVRFRDSDCVGGDTQVVFEIHRASLATGGNEVIYTFDSNSQACVGNLFQSAEIEVPIDFDFTNNVYWIEVRVRKNVAGMNAQLGSISIRENQ